MIGLGIELITGMMLGIEWNSDEKIIVLDLLIVRVVVMYGLEEE